MNQGFFQSLLIVSSFSIIISAKRSRALSSLFGPSVFCLLSGLLFSANRIPLPPLHLKFQCPHVISPETIYKTLYFRSREALHHLNIQHLRRSHSLRHGRRHTRKGERGTINIVNGTPIHERSRNIDNRRSLGHWEGDLVSGTKNSHIATLVDRKSRYTIILRLRGKDSVSVNQALTDKFLSLPSELRKSLTWDRGMELARHLEFTVSTGVKVYFCDPQSPWQRGTNENTNGLIRQYFPKKTCLAQYTQHELDLVAAQLNNRPRKTLKFKTPKEIIERGVALTD